MHNLKIFARSATRDADMATQTGHAHSFANVDMATTR